MLSHTFFLSLSLALLLFFLFSLSFFISPVPSFPPPTQISNKHVRFQVFLGVKGVALLDLSKVRVNDGEWHHVLMELKSIKDGKDIKYMALVSLDYGMFQVVSLNTSATPHDHMCL